MVKEWKQELTEEVLCLEALSSVSLEHMQELVAAANASMGADTGGYEIWKVLDEKSSECQGYSDPPRVNVRVM